MNRRILLLDRSPMLRRIGTGILQREIETCQVSSNARAAAGLAAGSAEKPDLILLDYSMPDMGVEDVCRHLGQSDSLSEVPVVLMYSNGADITALQKKYPIIRASLHKPLVAENLISTVTRLLESPHPPEKPTAVQPQENANGCRLALPEIPFSGDIGMTPLPALFQRLESGKEIGVLRLFSGKHPVEVYFSGGRVVLCGSRDLAAYCRESPSVIPPVKKEILDAAKRLHRKTGCPFFLALRDNEIFNGATAVNLCRDHGQRLFSRLWKELSVLFEFERTPYLPDFAAAFPLTQDKTVAWLLKTLRYLKANDIISTLFYPPNGTPFLTPGGPGIRDSLRLSKAESAFLASVDGKRTLQEIAWDNGYEIHDAELLFFRLHTLGLLNLWPPREPSECTPT